MKITIPLSGRIDTASASQAEQIIAQHLHEQDAQTLDKIVIDCTDLQYISSTGLRIFLKYKKQYPDFEVINVSNDVYSIFDMTGFARIMTVKKALRKVSIAGCKEIGRGGVGVIYRYDDDTIIKVFSPECTIDIPERERLMAREAFILGMPTAIPFDIVWVTDTQSYGMMTELLDCKTLGAMVNEDRDNYCYYAQLFGKMLRNMHQINVDPNTTLPHPADVYEANINRIAHHFLPEQIELIKYLVSKIPEGHSLLHCDCHPKNIMVRGQRGQEELLMIDMGEVSAGHPLFELLNVCSTFHAESFEPLVGFPIELSKPFWQETLKAYFDTADEALIGQYDEIITAASIVRATTWIALGNFPQPVIDSVRRLADQQLWKNREYYIEMAEKFKEIN